MKYKILALGLVVTFLFSGCGVEKTVFTKTPDSSQAGGRVDGCDIEKLEWKAGGEGATGSMLGFITATNHSQTPCYVENTIYVSLVDKAGGLVNVKIYQPNPTTTEKIIVTQNNSVSVKFHWYNWCAPIDPSGLWVKIEFPWSGQEKTLKIENIGYPRCDDEESPSTMGVEGAEIVAD